MREGNHTMLFTHGKIINKDDMRKLDAMFGIALLDDDFCHRLVEEKDDALLAEHGLTDETRIWLRRIPARSLTEMAQAVIGGV